LTWWYNLQRKAWQSSPAKSTKSLTIPIQLYFFAILVFLFFCEFCLEQIPTKTKISQNNTD